MEREPVVHYTFEERLKIEELLKKGISYREIGNQLNRSHYGIRNEIRRSGGRFEYSAEKANKIRVETHLKKYSSVGKRVTYLTLEDRKIIEQGLIQFLSYEEIGKLIDRSPSTVKNEIRKLNGRQNYTAEKAQAYLEQSILNRSEKLRTKYTIKQIDLLKEGFSKGWSKKRIRILAETSEEKLNYWMGQNRDLIEKWQQEVITFEDRLGSIESQLEIIFDLFKEKK